MPGITDYIQTPDQVQTLLNNGAIPPETAQLVLQRLAPENLIQSVMAAESSFDPNAVSPKGAQGLMQVLPSTAEWQAKQLGIQNPDLSNPAMNQILGATYLGDQLASSNGDIPLALAKYNAGPRRVKEYGGIPPYTQGYIDKVQNGMSQYAAPNVAPPEQPPTAQEPSQIAAPNMGQPEMPEVTPQDTIQAGLEMQKQAALGDVRAQEEASAKKAQLERQRGDEIKNIYQQEQAQQMIEQDKYQEAQQNYQNLLDNYRGTSVDRNRLWNNMSTPNKIMATLGIALGAIGVAKSRIPGQENQALNLINKAIDEDTTDQVRDLAQKGNVLTKQAGILDDLRSQFKDDSARRMALNGLKLESVKQDIQSIADNLQDTQQKSKAQELIGKFTEQQGIAAQQAAQIEAKRGQVDVDTVKSAINGDDQAMLSLPNITQMRIAPGLGLAQRQVDAKDVTEAYRGYLDAQAALNKLIQIRGDKSASNPQGQGRGAEVFNTGPAREAKQLAASLRAGLGKIDHLGPLSGRDYEFLSVQVPDDPTEFNLGNFVPGVGDTTLDLLKNLKAKTANSFRNVLESSLSIKSDKAQNMINSLGKDWEGSYGVIKQQPVTGMTPR